jgi:hypothetical protein
LLIPILTPDVGHELRELLLAEAEAFRCRLEHLGFADRADAAAAPGIAHAIVELARRQAEPGLPRRGHAEVRGDLKHAADVEHNRLNGHGRHDAAYRWGKTNGKQARMSVLVCIMVPKAGQPQWTKERQAE